MRNFVFDEPDSFISPNNCPNDPPLLVLTSSHFLDEEASKKRFDEVYGDTGRACKERMAAVGSPYGKSAIDH